MTTLNLDEIEKAIETSRGEQDREFRMAGPAMALVAEVRLLREQLKAERDAAALDLEVNLQRASTDD